MPGKLYLVATPIGNLRDITLRAIAVLKEADLILSEDTRTTAKLLNHYAIKKPLQAFHEHSSNRVIENLIQRLRRGQIIALVSEAGTPGLSDPGGKLVERAAAEGISSFPLPGPSALTCAISAAGLPMNRFLFLGFLPIKGRQKLFSYLKTVPYPLVIYESPYRLSKTLEEIQIQLGNRPLVIGREMTKMFEEFIRGRVEEVRQIIAKKKTLKGEIVVIVGYESPKKNHPASQENC